MRIEDENIDRLEPPERLDRRAAGVARGRADDGDPLSPPLQRGLEQLADQLHGEVLEGQRGPVEQLQQEVVGAKLDKRRARVVAEARIGAGDDVGQFRIGESVADEGAHDAEGGLFVAQPRQRRDVARRHLRDGLGDIEAAVARQPRQHRLLEA